MKFIVSILFILAGASASAMDVTVTCTPKGFACINECAWTKLGEGITTTVFMDQDFDNPAVWRGRYQSNLDGHLLTLNFKYDESKSRNPLLVNAYLAAANVMAETSGANSVDIALRNNNYGRGFVCTQIRSRE